MKTIFYYALADEKTLFSLTQKQQKEFIKLFPNSANGIVIDGEHEAAYEWIEKNGKKLGKIEIFAF